MKNIVFASLLFISPMVIQPAFSADAPHLRDDGSFTFSKKFSTAFLEHMERKVERSIKNGKITSQEEINAFKESLDTKYRPFAERKWDNECKNFFTGIFITSSMSLHHQRYSIWTNIFPVLFYAGDFGDHNTTNLEKIKRFFYKNTGKKIKERQTPIKMSDELRNIYSESTQKRMINYWDNLSPEEKKEFARKQSKKMKDYHRNMTLEDRERQKEAGRFRHKVLKQQKKDDAERNRVASLPLSHIPQARRMEAARRVSERSAQAVHEAMRQQEEITQQTGKRSRDNIQEVPQPKRRKTQEERPFGEVPQSNDHAHTVPQEHTTERTSFRVRAPRDVSPPPRVESASIFDLSVEQRLKIAERVRQKSGRVVKKGQQAQQKKPAKKG